MTRPDFATLDGELWLAGRLKEHGAHVFAGLTQPITRRERIRQAIVSNRLTRVIAGKGKDGKAKTYAQAFEALYGEPLEKTE